MTNEPVGGLGWIPETDPLKLARREPYGVRDLMPAVEITRKARPAEKVWEFSGPVLDQGSTGECTGYATKGFLITLPIDQSPADKPPAPFDIYVLGRQFAGLQPYDDPDGGCTTDGVWKALRSLGFVAEYRWARSLDDFLDWLGLFGPMTVGVNWKTGMDRPDANGVIHNTGTLRGGHEFCVRGYKMVNGVLCAACIQSWGLWGPLKGYFYIPVNELSDLIFKEGGEAAVGLEVAKDPTPPPDPTPTPPTPPSPQQPTPDTPGFPYQQTVPVRYDPVMNEWIYEFRIQRGTGLWNV